MALFSCSKEVTVDAIFIEKEFFIENPETATAKVIDFLSYTNLNETTLRSDYPDTEVNEGLWTLEASRNYIDNVNLSAKSDETINYTLSISNTVDNNIIKMSGADMTAKFNELQASISTEEANGKTAKIVDFELQDVSNQQTDLVVGVIYSDDPSIDIPDVGGPLNVDGCVDWPESQSIWSSGPTLEACLLNHTINYAWYQTVEFYNFEEISICGSNFDLSCQCMWEGSNDMNPDQFDDAYLTARTMVDCFILDAYGPPPPSNTSSQFGGSPLLVDIDLDGNALSSISVFFCNKVVIGRGIPK